jgi:hypothetical protein
MGVRPLDWSIKEQFNPPRGKPLGGFIVRMKIDFHFAVQPSVVVERPVVMDNIIIINLIYRHV